MAKVLISLFVHDLGINPVVRAAPIAFALQRLGFDIEVVGWLAEGEELWEPYADAFQYRTAARVQELAGLASGQIVYAFKPLAATLLPAMTYASFGLRKPVLLDVEDDDCSVCGRDPVRRLISTWKSSVTAPRSTIIPSITHQLRRRCDAITVSTSSLQRFYGGTKLLHGPDERVFDPARSDLDKERAREAFGLPKGRMLVLFCGTPWPHKGVDEITAAVRDRDCTLVLAGRPDHPEFRHAKQALGDKCRLIGFVKNADMPKLLSAVDIVPVLQRDVPYARAQMPAKLLEAMSMGKSLIVTSVGDLPDTVGANTKRTGAWVVRPSNSEDVKSALQSIASSPNLVRERSRNARRLFLERASVEINARKLRDIFMSSPRLRHLLPSLP